MKRGFTLVEFLIVIGILSLSVGSILLILTTVVKGANQTNIIGEVKQNGQNVLDTLAGQIRNATDVYSLDSGQIVFGQPLVVPTGATDAIWVWTSTGEKLTIVCIDSTDLGGTESGRISVYSGAATETRPALSTTGYSFYPVSNIDTKSGVDIDCTNTTFGVTSTGASKLVLLDFTAKQGVGAPSRVDYNASARFKTAISLRVYQ